MSQSHRDSPAPASAAAPITVLPARANKTSISSANQSLSPANTVRQTADRRKPETEIETETEAETEPETETETEPESKSESETKSEAKNRSSVQVAAKIKNLDCSLVGSTCPENSSNNNKNNEIEEKQCIKNRERIGKNESKLREKLKPRVQRRCGTLN